MRPLDDASLGRCVPRTMRSLDDVSLGLCVPWTMHSLNYAFLWTMHPLDDAPLGQCPLDDVFIGRCVPWTIRSLDYAFLGRCIPWTMRFFGRCIPWTMLQWTVSLGRCVHWTMCSLLHASLNDGSLSQPWTAYRRWIITKLLKETWVSPLLCSPIPTHRPRQVCGWDLAEWLERLTAYAEVATGLGFIPVSSDTVEF